LNEWTATTNQMTQTQFINMALEDQVQYLYKKGTFVTDIRSYDYKVNLFLLEGAYFEVFINQKEAQITKIQSMDYRSDRIDCYLDQVKLPVPN